MQREPSYSELPLTTIPARSYAALRLRPLVRVRSTYASCRRVRLLVNADLALACDIRPFNHPIGSCEYAAKPAESQ